jgi:hypothetical protein
MLDYPAAAAPAVEEEEEEDWFGEGNAFESGEELASALMALAAHPQPEASAAIEAAQPLVFTAPGVEGSFVLAEPAGVVTARRPQAARAEPPPRRWSVRASGTMALPPRAAGRSGWSIRNSVKVLQETEKVLTSLRQEAVAAALLAASRALRPE